MKNRRRDGWAILISMLLGILLAVGFHAVIILGTLACGLWVLIAIKFYVEEYEDKD